MNAADTNTDARMRLGMLALNCHFIRCVYNGIVRERAARRRIDVAIAVRIKEWGWCVEFLKHQIQTFSAMRKNEK